MIEADVMGLIKKSTLMRMTPHTIDEIMEIGYTLCAISITAAKLPRNDGTKNKLAAELDEIYAIIAKSIPKTKTQRLRQATILNALDMNSALLKP